MSQKTFQWTVMGSLLFAVPGAVWAQGQGPTATSTAANVPVLSSGQMPSSAPTANQPAENAYSLGITAGTYFDDNANLRATPRQWDLGYMVAPEISFTETLPRLDWSIEYEPGITISQNLLYRNQFSQGLNGNVAYLVSPHGLLTAQEYFMVSTNPFAQLGSSTAAPGPIVSPNQSPYIPNLRRTSTLTNALYSYQFSEHSSFGIGGNFNLSRFDNTPKSGPTTSLIYSQRASGEAYVSHQFSARETLGIQYGIQVLKFPHQDARTTTDTILIFNQVRLSPRSSFTIYGGPEYSDTFNQVELSLGFIVITIPVKAQQWSGSGGVMYNWSGQRLGLSLDFMRGISDGGGLVGAVELDSGNARISWRLSRRWNMFTELSGSNDTLLATSTNEGLLTYSERVGLSQQIWRDLSIQWYYERLNQTGGFANLPVGNHDFAGASLTYKLLRPIGR